MRLLDLPQARHFCAPTGTSSIGRQSLQSFHGAMKGVTLLQEGTTHFKVHQINLLDSVQRWLLYSLCHYRRSVDMFTPASAPWAQVTLYYASFFAANAILGIFGGWIGNTANGNRVVDVEHGTVGSQQLRIHRRFSSPSGEKGSHRAFWDIFYDAVAAIAAWAPAELAAALSPVNGDFGWQIAGRNRVNYDMFYAWDASSLFYNTFNNSRLNTLRGPLQLQFETTERTIKLAMHFAKEVSISTESLSGCGVTGSRLQIQKRLASQAPPNLVMQSDFREMLEI